MLISIHLETGLCLFLVFELWFRWFVLNFDLVFLLSSFSLLCSSQFSEYGIVIDAVYMAMGDLLLIIIFYFIQGLADYNS